MGDDFTHFDAEGKAAMVDVTDKPVTERSATAKGSVVMAPRDHREDPRGRREEG